MNTYPFLQQQAINNAFQSQMMNPFQSANPYGTSSFLLGNKKA
jgi:hypothetical protein